MPVSKPVDLPVNGGGRWPNTGFRSERWGDMEAGYTVAPVSDCAPLYQGLPGGVCQCPHYGYVLKGTVRCVYPGTDWPDEIAGTGELYFFPAGHLLAYEEESEIIEFNPAAALGTLMDYINERLGRFMSGELDISQIMADPKASDPGRATIHQ